MKDVVVCKHCGNQEYYGMMHSNNGTQMCRKCIYDVWVQKGGSIGDGYVFPLYADGKDYIRQA